MSTCSAMNLNDRIIEHEFSDKNGNNVQVCDGFRCLNESKETISFWIMLLRGERIRPTKWISNTRPISRSVIWENNAAKRFRSVRREDGFDFVIHHVCSCGHELCDHTYGIMDSSNEKCNIDGCSCNAFLL